MCMISLKGPVPGEVDRLNADALKELNQLILCASECLQTSYWVGQAYLCKTRVSHAPWQYGAPHLQVPPGWKGREQKGCSQS